MPYPGSGKGAFMDSAHPGLRDGDGGSGAAGAERVPGGREPVVAQNSVRPWNLYSDEGHGCRSPVIGERAALLRPDLRAWVLSASAHERRNCGPRRYPATQRRCRFGHRKRFRRRDARSDGASQGVPAAGRLPDVAGDEFELQCEATTNRNVSMTLRHLRS